MTNFTNIFRVKMSCFLYAHGEVSNLYTNLVGLLKNRSVKYTLNV